MAETARLRFRLSRERSPALATAALCLLLWMLLLAFVTLGGASDSSAQGAGLPIVQLVYSICFLLAGAAAMTDHRVRSYSVIPFGVWLVCGFCVLSATWAIQGAVSIRRFLLTFMVIYTTCSAVKVLGYPTTLRILRCAFGATLVFCYVAVALVPSIGIQPPSFELGQSAPAGWRGVFIDKNSCGAFCAITALIFLFETDGKELWRRRAFAVAAIVFLAESGSKTSAALLIAVVPLTYVVTWTGRVARPLLLPIWLSIFALFFAAWQWLLTPLAAALSDPAAFTGRGQIWAVLARYVSDHPLLGAGYGSFWAIGPSSPIFTYSPYAWVQKIYQGHNGYLDLAVQLGIPGAILCVVMLLLLPLVRASIGVGMTWAHSRLSVAVILFCAGNNLTESTLLKGETVLNFNLLFVVASLPAAPWSPLRRRLIATPPARRVDAARRFEPRG
jgi:O-antigen ligase